VLAARRSLDWSDDPDTLRDLLARGSIQVFRVLSFAGGNAGQFTVAGLVDLDTVTPVALGGYAGGPTCEPGSASERECQAMLTGCGVAVAAPAPFGDDSVVDVHTGTGCVVGTSLCVDTDEDGASEAFPLRAFMGPLREPTDEVTGGGGCKAPCEPRFARAAIVPGDNPKVWRGMDLVGVLDLDGDGRLEIILRYNYGDKATWAVYSPEQTSRRLTLVAESVPWQ